MGLDMYLNGHKYLWSGSREQPSVTEDGFRLKERILELGYWRKEPHLHGYIVEKFAGGKDECQDIELGMEDMLDIISAVKERRLLMDTTGFFFGTACDPNSSDPQEREWALQFEKDTIEIFEKAIEWVKGRVDTESRYVVYRASW